MSDWKQEAVKLAQQGMSWRKIARTLGKSKSSVSDYLRSLYGKNGTYLNKYVEDISTHQSDNLKQNSTINPYAKVLVLDIETSRMLLGGWGLYNQNFSLEQIEEDWSIISFASKWYGEDAVTYMDVSNHTEHDLLETLHGLFNQADFILAHNGRRFDYKKIRSRMIAHGFPPHSPIRILDTLEICKKEFGMTSNKLAYLTDLLCVRNKKSSHSKFPGYVLWKEFLNGNQEAIKEMREYNQIDILSLEELYDIIAPWSSTLPNFDLYQDDVLNNEDWVEDGYVYTNLSKFQRYRNVKTGQYKRGRKNLLSKEKRESILAGIV